MERRRRDFQRLYLSPPGKGRDTEAGGKPCKLPEATQAAPRRWLCSDLSFCSSVRERHGGFSSRRPETAESPLHMDHLLLTIIFTVQLWPPPSLSILPTWRSVPHIRNIVEINGAVNQDLCDLMLLYASVIDMLLRAVKSYLGGRYSNVLLLLLSNAISKSLGH